MICWDAPGPYEVVFSTRVGGVSKGPFASLNLGRLTADEPERVEENRARLLAEVGGDAERMTLNRQTHSTTVRRATAGSGGSRGTGSGPTSRASRSSPSPRTACRSHSRAWAAIVRR